jgi:hypothetical protein
VSYRPAQCNVGRRGRRRRAAFALASALVAAGVVVAYLVGVIPRLLLIGVFAPLALAFEFGVQAYESFCVTFALLGRYDFSDEGGERGRVADPANRRDDRLYALRITVASVVLAAVVTAGLFLVL